MCYRCNQKGHFARGCKNESQKKPKNANSDDSDDCALIAGKRAGDVKASGSEKGVACPAEFTSDELKDLLAMNQSEVWLTDSGPASRHLTHRREWLTDYRENRSGDVISLGDNRQ